MAEQAPALPGSAGAGAPARARPGASSLQAAASAATFAVAWRNLGRNRKRTMLTASAVGFASMLLVFAMSMQGGSYGAMIDNATRLLTGHVQIQDRRYFEDPKMRHLVPDADARVAALEADPRVAAASPRVLAFAVLSGADRSFGAQVMGVDPERERAFSLLPEFLDAGRWLGAARGEIVLGTALARNLDVALGDEVVILGTAPDGSIAAAVATLVGLLGTGQPEIDRSLAQMHVEDLREAFLLGDAAHAIVLTLADVRAADALAGPLLGVAGGDEALRALTWRELIPELEQLIELDKASAYFFYVLLALMVTFSITNTFMMTVFERTREFGTLLAIGCRPGFVIALLQIESLLLCGLGVLGGTLLGIALTGGLMVVGIPLDEMGAELLRQYHMPERLYPTLSVEAVLSGPLFMLAATQIAALLPALRLRRLEPVAALRTDVVPVSLLLSLSWRNLLRNARRTFMLSLAVAVGVASLVLMAALLRGWLASTVDEALDGLVGHLRLHDPAWLDDPGADASFPLPEAWGLTLDDDEDVLAWTARIRVPAVVMSERETRGGMIVGVDQRAERDLSFLGDAEIEGRGLEGLEDGGLLIGAALAEELETELGKRVVLMMQGADGGTVERGYRIVGVYDVQGEGLEKAFLFTGRVALARTLLLRDEVATEVSVRLHPERAEALDAVAARIGASAAAQVDAEIVVRDWRDLVPQAAAMVEISDTSILVWYLILMSALGFGLVNTLLTSVMERVRELGLLQAVGMRPAGVLWQVLLESWLVLVVGLVAGLLGGLLCIWWLEDGIDLRNWSEGLEMFGISRVLVPRLFLSDLLEIGAVVLGLGLLGSIYPARKAVAIDPLKALNRQQE